MINPKKPIRKQTILKMKNTVSMFDTIELSFASIELAADNPKAMNKKAPIIAINIKFCSILLVFNC